MKNFRIYNWNISVASVKANSEKEAINIYCNNRNIYDQTPYKAIETARPIF